MVRPTPKRRTWSWQTVLDTKQLANLGLTPREGEHVPEHLDLALKPRAQAAARRAGADLWPGPGVWVRDGMKVLWAVRYTGGQPG